MDNWNEIENGESTVTYILTMEVYVYLFHSGVFIEDSTGSFDSEEIVVISTFFDGRT